MKEKDKTSISIPSISNSLVVESIPPTKLLQELKESTLKVDSFSEAMISVEVNPHNLIFGKYVLYGVGELKEDIEVLPRLARETFINAEITPVITDTKNLLTEINIVYDGRNDILVEVQPFNQFNLPTVVEVPPHNQMAGIYEIQQPPIVESIRTPIKDAFTRSKAEYAAINYGFNTTMAVGSNLDDVWRSYVEFDLDNFPRNYKIVSSKMRFYYKGTLNENVKLEITDLKSEWHEYSITDLNRPTPLTELTQEFKVNHKEKFIEFEITSSIKAWLQGNKKNNGFLIRLVNESIPSAVTFHTRESNKPPELIIEYYDTRIFSSGRSDVITEFNIVIARNSDIRVIVEPSSIYSTSSCDIELFCHIREEYVYDDILAEITASTPFKLAKISSRRSQKLEELVEVSVCTDEISEKETIIDVSRPQLLTDMFIRYTKDVLCELYVLYIQDIDIELDITRTDIDSELIARVSSQSEKEVCVYVNRADALAEIKSVIAYNEDINVQLNVYPYPKNDKLVEFNISNPSIKSEVSVRRESFNQVRTQVEVTNDTRLLEFFIRLSNDLETEITPNIKSDTETEIIITYPNLFVEVSNRKPESSDISTILTVQKIFEEDAELFVRYTDVIEIEIEPRMVSSIYAEVASNTPIRIAEVTIPYLAESDMWSVVYPKIYAVNDVPAMVFIGSGNGAYAFII